MRRTSSSLVAAAIALGFAAAPSAAQVQSGGALPDPSSKLALDPLVTTGTLDNGVRYFIRANQLPLKRAELRLAVNAGAVLEAPDQVGLAHFVEHMAFNGTASFPKQDLVHYLQSIGTRFGADLNAYTSFDETVYMLTVPTDTGNYVRRGIQILGEWAHRVKFDSAEVEAERGVVTEEWRLGRGAGARMRDKQFPTLFKGSLYGERLPIGTAENLKKAPRSALVRFYQDWYRPEQMAVIAIGDFDKADIERMIREEFSKIPKSATPKTRPVAAVPAHDSIYVSIATDHEASSTTIEVMSKLPPRDQTTVRSFRERYVQRLGSSMLNARLNDLAQGQNPPFAFGQVSRGYFVRSADIFDVFAGLREGGALTGLEALLTETERVARHGFTQTELDRARTAALRSTERQYAEREKRPSASRADELVRHFLQGEDAVGTEAEFRLYNQLAPGVTLAEVNAAMRSLIAAKSQVVLLNAPEKAGSTLPTEAQLLGVFAKVKAKNIEPYKDNVVTAPLLAKLPTPGTITATKTIAEIGVTEWKLSNGVTVVLKPTDYSADQILLTGTSPGGTSLVPDSSYVSAMLASTAASVGGIGDLNSADMRRVLTGKLANANSNISARSETVTGTASPKDVETMFQLVYMRFTAPRKDSIAFAAFRQSMEAQMANSAATPISAFRDTLTATMTQNAFRARPMSPALLREADLNRAFEVYRDRFADASDFTFFIVGTFNVDSIRPLVQRYLGGLPALNRKEVAKDDGIRPPKGVIEKTVRRGVEPQSQTVLTFTAPYDHTTENAYTLASMNDVMRNRLIDKLREALGGTYGVSVNVSGNRDVTKLTTVTVSFGSSPERADELAKAIFEDIRDLQEKGPTAADVAKVQEAQRRVRETNLRTNNFWTGSLSSAYQYGDDPRDVLKYDALVSGLTPEKIRDAARKYIKTDNYVRVTLLPEAKRP
jgi:zinc protease